MSWIWNLFFGTSNKVGECEGDCKEDVERVARECLKLKVDADLKRNPVNVPCKHGWWDDCNQKSNH